MKDEQSPRIKILRLEHARDINAPARMTAGASGCDVCAAIENDITLEPGKRALVPTGFIFEIPTGYEVQVRSRSGLAVKNGIMVLNSPGTIDSDYRGEVKVILANLGNEPFTIRRGDRIAQLVPTRVASDILFHETGNLGETSRGAGGFGSSGV